MAQPALLSLEAEIKRYNQARELLIGLSKLFLGKSKLILDKIFKIFREQTEIA